jgi:acyl carrier protein
MVATAGFDGVRITMTREKISEFCIVSLAKVLRVPQNTIAVDTKFPRLGLDSAMLVYVMMELEEKFGLELSPDDFYDFPTINDLSQSLAQRRKTRSAA